MSLCLRCSDDHHKRCIAASKLQGVCAQLLVKHGCQLPGQQSKPAFCRFLHHGVASPGRM